MHVQPTYVIRVGFDVGVAAAVVRNNTVLLVQEARGPYKDRWGLPKGYVDPDESIENAVLRELKEETGMDGTDAKLLMVMGDPKRDPRKHIVSIVYEIQVDEQQQPLAGDDAADARFWPIETLLSGEVEFAGDHLTILKNWLNQ